MGRSRRKYKKSRTKVRVGLPKKKPGVFKPAVAIPPSLAAAGRGGDAATAVEWDAKGSVISNYRSFGVVANPNLLGVRARTPHIVQSSPLQVPQRRADDPPARASEFDPIDTGSDLENDDLKSALGKKRRDGKLAPLPPLTTLQRLYIGRLIEKYGDDHQAMFMDTKLNEMQHSVGTLKKLCQRYHVRGKHYIAS
ncbi:uncharacterized protein LOC109709027 [Ananas comosus]|uniref:Nucleolar protein 16 n=1 Tax=Ananas comosus TaxID=4615 RepID=A0A6P5ESZ1_ANACO|nr:uncharacterized protein LOC109709027 [Ananas comosus]